MVGCECLSKGTVACCVELSVPAPHSHWSPAAIVGQTQQMNVCSVSQKMFSNKHFARNPGPSHPSDRVFVREKNSFSFHIEVGRKP